ncbi:hypothetical protein ACHHRT_03115 [Desulfurivibrio sp. D14AmB]|uniref:hypothetical protein n=1 Tax=Desulfurivibrio sp. D14AmB TaxID=3374370 RepID=UPI00376EA1AD
MQGYKRRRYLVDGGTFQYGFLLPFLVSWLLATAVATTVFNWLVRREIENLLWRAHVTLHTTDQVIGKIFFHTVMLTLLLLLLLVALSCWWVKRKSSGVATRMVNDLRAVAAGDFSQRIRLRRKDAFQDVAAALNDFLEGQVVRYREARDGLGEIRTDLGRLRLAAARGAVPAGDLEQLQGKVQRLRRAMAPEK